MLFCMLFDHRKLHKFLQYNKYMYLMIFWVNAWMEQELFFIFSSEVSWVPAQIACLCCLHLLVEDVFSH